MDLLEKAIITGKFLPGERLSEAGLAKQLGVSRVPVREALIRLEELQLVRKTYRGREVVRFSSDDLRDLFEVKILIESYSASKGCKTATPQIKKRLRRLVDRMDECLEPLDYPKLRKVSDQFHNLLVESSGNRKLYEIYLTVVKHTRWTTHTSLERPGRLELSTKEHREIFDAFESGDQKIVKEVIEKHTLEVQEQVIQALKRVENR